MALRVSKPTGNARRQLSVTNFSSLDKNSREKSLTRGKNRVAGRNSAGQLVVSGRGGGEKRLYRLVDFKRVDHLSEKAQVLGIEYDPNRSSNIALIQYEKGEKSYIIAPDGLKKDKEVVCDEKTLVKIGNRMKLKNIPPATQLHDIELTPGKGGQICRSAGNFATLLGFDGKYAQLRLPSGEVRKVLAECFASVGVVSNTDHANIKVGKAGRTRHMSRRPTVRGKAKNPCDHPHGGGEGANSIGMKYPKTPWGAPALGRRTRNKKKASGKLIMTRRKK
jgi:large subunit ribosomal protein L2